MLALERIHTDVYDLRKERIDTIPQLSCEKLGILTLSGEVEILTLRSAIPESGNRDKVRIRVIALVSSLLIILIRG